MVSQIDIYNKLGEKDAATRDQVMADLGMTRDMVERNLSVGDYLREIGKPEMAEIFEDELRAARRPDIRKIGAIAPTIRSQAPASPRFQDRRSPVLNMAVPASQIAAAYGEFTKAAETYPLDEITLAAHSAMTDKGLGVIDFFNSVIISNVPHGGSLLSGFFGRDVAPNIIQQTRDNIQNATTVFCKADRKIAAEYAAANTYAKGSGPHPFSGGHATSQQLSREESEALRKFSGGRKFEISALTAKESAAFENLWNVMEYHGGTKLVARRLRDQLGSAPMFSTGAGVGVSMALAFMENGSGMPSMDFAMENLKSAAKVSLTVGALVSMFIPGAETAVMMALGGAGVAILKCRRTIEEWHAKHNSADGQKDFLYEAGVEAAKDIAAHPEVYTDEVLRHEMQARAEASAKAIAQGYYVCEDVRVLQRYDRSAPHWFKGEGVPEALAKRSEALVTFIDKAKIWQAREAYIAGATDRPKGLSEQGLDFLR